MKIRIVGGALVAMLAVTSIANAQSRTPVIDRREHRQERRIAQGVRSGELTRHEARNLRRSERSIRTEKRMAMADGRVTPAERRHLRHKENRVSRHIYRAKHNDPVRG